MEQWPTREPPRRFHLAKRMSVEDGKPPRFPLPSSLEAFTRPISALARHRVHQLSDIREVSGSSRANTINNPIPVPGWNDGAPERPQTPAPAPQPDALSHTTSSEYLTPTALRTGPRALATALGNRTASAISLPRRHVPERRSSASIFSRSRAGSVPGSMQDMPAWTVPDGDDDGGGGSVIPHRGRAESPVRRAMGRSAQSSEILRPTLARTFIRTSPPHEVLDHGSVRHPRVELSLRLPSPLFVGGGTVEGQIAVQVDGGLPRRTKMKPIYISSACIDVIGVEEVNDGRRWVFLSLATELFDQSHPPPPSLVTSQAPVPGPSVWWELEAARSVVPFCVNLPLKLGPPPYASRQAAIRYLLCPAVMIRVGEKKSVVRQTWSVQMFTVHNPEKALASLPSPLLAADTLYLNREPDLQTVKLTAGLHRQTWVNGAMIFVDVHIANNTAKPIKKIEVQLEKTTLWYVHAPAGTTEKSANHLRLPKRTDSDVVSGTALKKSPTWPGVPARASEVRTMELEAPRGHVTVSTGRYFEVRYFVNVVVTVRVFKTVAVQLPVTIIPMNSLDVLPNSLAQVAASIEAKRTKTVPLPLPPQAGPAHAPYHQGQAFTVPLRQSLELHAGDPTGMPAHELHALSHDIGPSPRRWAHQEGLSRVGRRSEPPDENAPPGRPSGASSSSHHHVRRHPSCYHCHVASEHDVGKPPDRPCLPRLQVSTSGLGFSESEFEVPANSPPRKVMLSERERNMINQQRELRDRQDRTQKRMVGAAVDAGRADDARPSKDGPSWNNVVANADVGPKAPEFGNLSPGGVGGRASMAAVRDRDLRPRAAMTVRSRSKTNPEGMARRIGPGTSRRRSSTDRHDRGRVAVDGPAPAPSGAHAHAHAHASASANPNARRSTEAAPRASLDQLF